VAESTEDVQKMGAMAPLDEPYFVAGFWNVMSKRVVWLVVLFLGGLLTAVALRHYQNTLQLVELVIFMPLIISAGGNSGSQSATLVIRALATGELRVNQFASVFVREAGMGVSLGLILGVIGFLRAILLPGTGGHPMGVAMVVGLTIVSVVLVGCVIGSLFPLLLKRMGLDPALMSAPFIASLVDVTGIVIYFTIAHFVLGV
jgi:magnesium transporter